MCLARRRELLRHTDVQLLRSDPEPDAAAAAQRLGLLDLLEGEQPTEEAAGLGLAAGRRGQLDVIDAVEHSREG